MCDIVERVYQELPLPGEPDYDDTFGHTSDRSRAAAKLILEIVGFETPTLEDLVKELNYTPQQLRSLAEYIEKYN